MLRGDNGILNRASEASYANKIGTFKEQVNLAQMAVRTTISSKSAGSAGYIATDGNATNKTGNFYDLTKMVADELNAKTDAFNTEGYTVKGYLDTKGDTSTNGAGYIAIWYTDNSFRASLPSKAEDVKKVFIDTHKFNTVPNPIQSGRNEATLLYVIYVTNYSCTLSNGVYTNETTAKSDFGKGTYAETNIKSSNSAGSQSDFLNGTPVATSSSGSSSSQTGGSSGNQTGGQTGGNTGSQTGGTSSVVTIIAAGGTPTVPTGSKTLADNFVSTMVGKYVKYPAGVWGSTNDAVMKQLGKGDAKYENYSGETAPNDQGQFGGWKQNTWAATGVSSSDKNGQCYVGSIPAWKILGKDSNGCVQLMATYITEAYYHDTNASASEALLNGSGTRSFSIYENTELAVSGSAHAMTQAEAASLPDNNSRKATTLSGMAGLSSSNYYWLGTANGSLYLYNVYSDGGINYSIGLCYGVRPVVSLKSDILFSGTGTASDPYVVGYSN